MEKIFLILFIHLTILLTSSACIKKEQRPSNENRIVDLLNQNKPDDALEKVNQELNVHKTDELLYLKASILSMKAGVDIYALFPLLKVRIFDVAISQWSQNREFQRKLDAQKTNIILSPQDIEDQKNGEGKKEFVPLKGKDLDYSLDQIYTDTPYTSENGFCGITLVITPVKKIDEYNYIWFTTPVNTEEVCNEILNGKTNAETFKISSSLDTTIRNIISNRYKNQWAEHKDQVNKKENYVKIIGNMWTLVDMIPMISKIPKVSPDGFKNLEESEEILSQLKESHGISDELGEKSRKQLMMLASLKIIAHIQNAFNLTLAKTPTEFLCNSNAEAAEEIIESEQDALYLINAIEDPEVLKKNKELFEDIKSKYKSIIQEENNDPSIKEYRIRKVREELERFKKSTCQ